MQSAESQLPKEWTISPAEGVKTGQIVRPLGSVGCYVPGGRYPLPSTLLMTATPAQVALAWMLQKPVVTAPVVGACKPHHLDDAVAALSLNLTPHEIAALEEPYLPHPIVGFT